MTAHKRAYKALNIWFAGCKTSIYYYAAQPKCDIAAWQGIKWFMRRKWLNESRPINITPLLKTIVILISEFQQKLWVYWKDKVLFSHGRLGFLKQQWLFQQGITSVELPCLDLGWAWVLPISYHIWEKLRGRKKEAFIWLFFFFLLVGVICLNQSWF